MANILIIGGGVAGLSAGIYLQMAGHHAIVCERHSAAGGNLTGWNREGYRIDNCIHWLTGTNPRSKFYKIWEDLGVLGKVKVHYADSLYTCESAGGSLSLYRDIDKLEREMLKISPEDEKEIRSLIRAIKLMQGFSGTAGKNHDETASFIDTVRGVPLLLKYLTLTTGELAERFKHPLLRSFILAFWGKSFGALGLLVTFETICSDNGGLPEGGSVAMAERMVNRLTELGGELMLSKEVVKINRNGKRAESVVLADGRVIPADYIVIAAEPATVYGSILDIPMPGKLLSQYNDTRLKRFSSYQCAFACDVERLPFTGDLIFDIPADKREFLDTDQLILREFSHEPSYAPKGKSIIQTLTFCFGDEKILEFIELRKKDKEAYRAKKAELSNTLKGLIIERFPELEGKLECIDVWTPATYKRYTGAEVGSFMSYALPSRFLPAPISSLATGIKNVILGTQWQQLPGGLPTAAECGKKAAEAIVKLEKKIPVEKMKAAAALS